MTPPKTNKHTNTTKPTNKKYPNPKAEIGIVKK